MTESIENRLNAAMKSAMKSKDKGSLTTVRMVKAAMQDFMNQPNAPAQATDALWQGVIGGYVKKLDKAAVEFQKVGERGAEKLVEIEAEKTFLKPYLPTQIEGDALKDIVRQAVQSSGAQSQKDTGRVMGSIMKDYKGLVDSKQVKDLVGELLAD